MKRNLGAEANVARSLIRAGLLFNAYGATQADEGLITIFQIPFGGLEHPFEVYAYLSGTLFVAQSACVLTTDDESVRSSMYEAVMARPLVRIVRDKVSEVPLLHWVEAFAILAEEHWLLADPVSHPVHAVAAAMTALQRTFPNQLTFSATPTQQMRVLGGPNFSSTIDQVVAPR